MAKIKERIFDAAVQSIFSALLPSNIWQTIGSGIMTIVVVIGGYFQQWSWPTLLIAGLVTLACSLIIIEKLSPWLGKRKTQAVIAQPLNPMQTSSEAEIDQWHNNRNVPLRIEFVDNSDYKYIGKRTGVGIWEGHSQAYRVIVHNTTNSDIEDVQVCLTSISPMPDELNGCVPLPLHVTHEPTGINRIRLGAHKKELVDVVSFFDRIASCDIRLEHTSTTVKQEIYQGDEGYEIGLTVSGEQVQPSSRRFKICVTRGNDKTLTMKSLAQTHEEAFHEA